MARPARERTETWKRGFGHLIGPRWRRAVSASRFCGPALVAVALVIGLIAARSAGAPAANGWVEAMKRTHAKFTGRRGTFAHFGDSITVTMAFWAPLPHARRNAPPAMERAFQTVNAYMRPECWRAWKGAEFGSEGGRTIRWAYEKVEVWLKKLNPEVALIMFGSNDLHALQRDEYREKMRAVVQKCLDNGTLVLLSTPPPRHGFEQKAADFAEAVREVAREKQVPLIDFYAEILQRRPGDWDGALDRFRDYQDYDVPTLLARDGVHPSHPQKYQNDYSEEALSRNGYSLRNYLVLMKYAEVLQKLGLNSPHSGPPERDTQHPAPSTQPPLVKPWFPKAPPLPPPMGEVIRVSTVDELFAAVARVRPGGTILVADGLYAMPRRLEIQTDNVTLRGASGQREKVILDGGGMGELLAITACAGVTIADLTVQNVRWNGIKLNTETNVQKVTIYNCVLRNIWQRAIKGVIVPEKDRERIRPRGGRVQYCLFYNDRAKQYADDPADTAENFGGNYIGGIDVMYVKDWVISDNLFIGIQGRTRGARGAIFIWHDSQDCLIERNVIIDCDSGICLGNSHKPVDVMVHCSRIVVRNNFVTRAPENGILADYTRDCKIVHNTVHDPQNRLGRLIRLVHANDGLRVANNLLSGPPLRNESESRIELRGNLEQEMTAAFVAAEEGNLRLTARAADAIDRAAPLLEVTEDIDRQPRGERPDIGAHEFRSKNAQRPDPH